MQDEDPHSRMSGGTMVAIAVALLLVPFIPLILSAVEHALYRTHKVDFFKLIGLHDALGKLYGAMRHLFSR